MQPTIFNFDGREIATQVDEDGSPLFMAKDIAVALGYADPGRAVREHVPEHGRVNRPLIDSMGRNQVAQFVTELGLFRLIMRSKLESAERFQDWVCGEVLPSIRKHGAYIAPTDDPEKLKRQLEYAQANLAGNAKRIDRLELEKNQLTARLDDFQVKVNTMHHDLATAHARIKEETEVADKATAKLLSKEFEVFEPVLGFETELTDENIAPRRMRSIMLKLGIDSSDAKYLNGVARDLIRYKRLRAIYVRVAEKLRTLQSATE